MRLTKDAVDKAQPPADKDQVFYRDDHLKGFALRVTAKGVKSFVVETMIDHKVRRMTLGKYGKLTAEEARKEAKSLLGQIAKGGNPIAERKAKKIRGVTLRRAFADYLSARKSLKPLTVKDYHRVLQQVVPDWMEKPITSISKDMIVRRHTQYGESNSKAGANLAMRLLRAIFNFASNQYQGEDGQPIIGTNPVRFLSHARSWYRIERRQTVIRRHQLADWYGGLMRLSEWYPSQQALLWQDYFLLILLTGMRRTEAASIRWENVDMKARTFTLHDTKNRDTHTLPMSDAIYSLFEGRQQVVCNPFVFAADSGSGHLIEPRKAMLKVTELSGVAFTVHDLRRTFITTAESLDIAAYALKRLLNHKSGNDVTAGYLIIDVERLRKPMQQITDHLLKCMGQMPTAGVTDLGKFKEGVINDYCG